MRIVKWLAGTIIGASVAALLLNISGHQDRWARLDRVSGGSARRLLSLDADTSIRGWLQSTRPSLGIACSDRAGFELFVMTKQAAAVEPGNHRSVRLQFDDERPSIVEWIQTENRQALVAPPDQARALANRLARARRFTFAFVPFNADPAVATFSLTGVGERWQALEAACRGENGGDGRVSPFPP